MDPAAVNLLTRATSAEVELVGREVQVEPPLGGVYKINLTHWMTSFDGNWNHRKQLAEHDCIKLKTAENIDDHFYSH
jgi:hypothetical protein